jgi:CBS domain containing-hemolysin-like protein
VEIRSLVNSKLLNVFLKKEIQEKNKIDKELEQFVAKRINADDLKGNSLSHENELLKNLAGLRGITASDVMVPRINIVSVAMSDDFNEIVRQLIVANHSRVPVRNESLDDIVGIIHIKDVLAHLYSKEKKDIKSLLKEPIFVSPSISLLDLLHEMRIKRRHLALVVDEYGGIDGLVTIEDLVEELVGEIEDEHDSLTECRLDKMPDGSLIVEARIAIDLLEDFLISIKQQDLNEEIDTLGGFIISISGRVPVIGEVVRHSSSGLEFEILDADPRRIVLVRIRGLNDVSNINKNKF